MDNFTHTAVGLMMARCGLEKTAVRGAGMMMIAANIPDIDAVTWFDRIHYLEYHRSYTHALPMAPLMAILPILMVRAKFTWPVYAAALAGVLSHDLLDWTNPYGIQLLLPFSSQRFMLDMTNIFDVWIWLVLLTGILAPLLAGLVAGEIGARPKPGVRSGWAWIALSVLSLYEGGRFLAHDRAVNMIASHLYEGAPPRNAIAVPAGRVDENPLAWKGVVEGVTAPAPASATPDSASTTPDSASAAPGSVSFAEVIPVNVTQAFDPGAGKIYYEAPPGTAIHEARKLPQFQVMLKFSQAPFWKVTPVQNGALVELMDLRYGTPDRPGFAVVSSVVEAVVR